MHNRYGEYEATIGMVGMKRTIGMVGMKRTIGMAGMKPQLVWQV